MMHIFVPKGDSILKALASFGNSITNAWLLFHNNAIKELLPNADFNCADSSFQLKVKGTEQTPEAKLYFKNIIGDWAFCSKIESEKINFNTPPNTPDKILFIVTGEEED